MTMGWIKNTAGKPDSQLTLLCAWNVLAMVVVIATVAGAIAGHQVEVDPSTWAFLAGAIGIPSWTYRGRRRDDAAAAAAAAEDGDQ